MQREAIGRAAKQRGDRIGTWFEETRSARALARPVLDRVRELARKGEISVLYVYRLDRLSRSGIRDMLGVLEELQRAGCQVVTLADGFELTGAWAEVVVSVIAWAAQMERLAIGERIASARTRVEASGGAWGRPPTVLRKTVERARALLDSGRSMSAVARELDVPRTSLAYALKRRSKADEKLRGEKRRPLTAKRRLRGG